MSHSLIFLSREKKRVSGDLPKITQEHDVKVVSSCHDVTRPYFCVVAVADNGECQSITKLTLTFSLKLYLTLLPVAIS